jgi:SAM-dependent methyltransferase
MEATIHVETQRKSETRTLVAFFVPTIFLGAFLLFCCEPMVGKMMLPLLGGAASVWITCLLFFQLMLLAGYGYAHALERYAKVRTQILIHALLMLVAVLFLPIRFAVHPDASVSAHPTLWLLLMLVRSLGLPFCVVSTTAPLLQNWLSKTRTTSARDPYFLYAISNAGSLLALLSYPVWIEPRWGVHLQSSGWAIGYGILLIFVITGGAILWSHLQESPNSSAPTLEAASQASWNNRLFWLAASFVPSALMLAVTNHMLLNLASVPFLWVMPLALYLITFMIAFARRFHLSERMLSAILPIILLVLFPLVAVARPVQSKTLLFLLGAHMLVLFAGALLCHTALAARRPDTSQLTDFYLWIAIGGALGGIFIAVIAPFVFSTVIEYPLLVATIALFRRTREEKINWGDFAYPAVVGLLAAGTWYLLKWTSVDILGDLKSSLSVDAVLVLIAYLAQKRRWRFALTVAVLIAGYRIGLPKLIDDDEELLHVDRDFFGVKRVVFDLDSNERKLMHGDTLHGVESLDPTLSGKPLSYYHETGPVGDIMKMINSRPNQHVGVVGLGTGSMAGWGGASRHITFFDIDPQVYPIAYNFFTFLRRCANNCNVVIGDGRLSIERAPDNEFDVLMLDAFSSDSIPAHLVSREAVQTYLKKLKPDGLILFHVSNRYMNVEGLASSVLIDAGLKGLVRYDDSEDDPGKAASDYVVAARNKSDFGELNDNDNWTEVQRPSGIQPWTDDYSNMMAIVRWP